MRAVVLRAIVRSIAALGAIVAAGALAAPASALTVDPGASAQVAEGSTFVRTLVIDDPVDDGEPGRTYTVSFGDGTPDLTGTTLQNDIPVSHLYADGPLNATLTVTVTDTPTDVGTASVAISVLNISPTLTVTAAPTTPEGSTYSIGVSGVDPGGARDPLMMMVDWGDGFGFQVLQPIGPASHLYRDDQNGLVNATPHTIYVTIYDDDGGVAQQILQVSVLNVAPTVTLTGASTADVGATYTLGVGPIADPGTDTVSGLTVNWGDGTTTPLTAAGSTTHVYATAGTRTITVDVTDEDGSHLTAGQKTLTVGLVAPSAPTNLTATTLTKSSIRLNWTNTSTTQTQVVIQRCKGTGCSSFSTIATVSGTSSTFSDSRLSSRTSYSYRVRATNGAGSSTYSNVATAVTFR